MHVPQEMDLRHYIAEAEQEQPYDLTAVVVYRGNAKQGHYFTYIKANGEWYLKDDKCVIKVELCALLPWSDSFDVCVVSAADHQMHRVYRPMNFTVLCRLDARR